MRGYSRLDKDVIEMTKTRIGGNKDGMGLYEISRLELAKHKSILFYISMFFIWCHMDRAAKIFLGLR